MTKHILISGGSRGLGKALVAGLLDADYAVSTFSRSATPFVEELADQERFYFDEADVADSEQTAQFVDAAVARFGRPFGLINCAGIARDGVLPTMPEAVIDQLVQINLSGTMKLSRQVIRSMLLAPGPGVILNISSIIGLRGYRGLAAYAATKAGMDGITRALARELGSREIRVNSIAPGYIATDMVRAVPEKVLEKIVARIPVGRLGQADEIARGVAFLVAPEAGFITGSTLSINGGQHMY